MYLAITQGAADWLLPKIGLVECLSRLILSGNDEKRVAISGQVFAEGPIRLAWRDDLNLVALWHIDYLTGTGEEPWGFLRLKGEVAFCDASDIAHVVLERFLYVSNQRLQGLMIDGSYYPRSYDGGIHTLLAGRGEAARHSSIAYLEKAIGASDDRTRALVCVGPSDRFKSLIAEADKERLRVERLVKNANSVVLTVHGSDLMPNESFAELRLAIAPYLESVQSNAYENVEVSASECIAAPTLFASISNKYEDWISSDSSLTETQRRVLMSDGIDHHPIRILGPGGSGKTLLMQLLTARKFIASISGQNKRIFYVVHNEAMRGKVVQQLEHLLEISLDLTSSNSDSYIVVNTLSEYARQQLGLDLESVLDPDAADAKDFQLAQVREALESVAAESKAIIAKSPLLSQIYANDSLLSVFSGLVLAEISVAIKGHGLEADKKRYVESERSLSRLHGVLGNTERDFIFEVFMQYHKSVFETYGVLDPDDVAISLTMRLRTPVWQLRRRTEGFDYVFVDEAQLFNENERRILPLLTKGNTPHVPIALALDEAQSFYGQWAAGLSTLGIKDISNESLDAVHRCTSSILKLAFFVIQKSTDLFGPDFPNFTKAAANTLQDDHPLAAAPTIEYESEDVRTLGKFVLKRVRDLRKANVRQILIVCHADSYFENLEQELSAAALPFQILRERGEKIRNDQPIVVLGRPSQIGGQEFDAVIIVGLEMGVAPPRVVNNDALGAAVEQQTIREMYLSITRAKYRVVFVLSHGSMPNAILSQAKSIQLVAVK